ncbi:hypothetical protein OK016_02345 [Vibrio chagasii]|nr:hypothetical protein [Vibrio chagasii]
MRLIGGLNFIAALSQHLSIWIKKITIFDKPANDAIHLYMYQRSAICCDLKYDKHFLWLLMVVSLTIAAYGYPTANFNAESGIIELYNAH